MFLHINFEKTFDTVNWEYLISVMRQMGFGETWCTWITSFLKFASVSVLINGNPTKEFKMERGLRERDPLSPFIFLIVVEGLHVMVYEAVEKKIFKGINLDSGGTTLSH